MLTLLFLIALALVAAVIWYSAGPTERAGVGRGRDGAAGNEPVRVKSPQGRPVPVGRDMEVAEEVQGNTLHRGKVVQLRERAGGAPATENEGAVRALPEREYGDDLVALVRNPRSLYVYWEEGSPEAQRLRSTLGEELWQTTVPCLRVFDVTSGGHPSLPGSHTLVVDLAEEQDHAFITQGLEPGHRYVVTHERRTREGRYYLIAHSSPVAMPHDGPGEDSPLYQLYGRQQGHWSGSPWR